VIIALPAIFRGIHLDPLAPGNIAYLLWMIMGYRLVQAVTVVNFGRLGDMFGRVRIYNAGFVVFTVSSILLSLCPFVGVRGAQWLIGWRLIQALGGSMLTANSAAILTDAFPKEKRGFALGLNQVFGLSGMFVGLVAGGLLATVDWRLVFWVNVPVGVFGTLWAYWRLREISAVQGGRIDWWGNVTFAVGLGAVLVAVTYGIQPYGHHTMGWTNPLVVGLLVGGVVLLAVFIVIETKIAEPLFQLSLFRIRAFTAGNVAGFAVSIARGGLQFMLIIWLQGIWLPLHGYQYSDTPLWAGIFLLPLTAGFLISGPVAGTLSDRFGARGMASAGMVVFGGSFVGLLLLPIDFSYWVFALLIAANGIGSGMFAAPNTSSIMGSVPAKYRGVASGMRSTFQNSGTALSIGAFFSLMIAGLASTLPIALTGGLQRQGVPHGIAQHVGALPPVSSLFAAVLGVNPLQHLLAASHVLSTLPAVAQRTIIGREFFPNLISAPFHHGLRVVFAVAAGLAVLAGLASLLRGGRAVQPHGQLPPPTGSQATPQPGDEPPMTNLLPTIDPRRTALLVMDYQPAILGAIDEPEDLLSRVADAIAIVRRSGGKVGYVRVAFEDADIEAVPATSMMASAIASGGQALHSDAPASAVHDRLAPEPGDIIVRKTRVGAFSTTDLHEQLRDRALDTLILAGISTSGVVLSTVRDAHDRDYRLFVLADASADPDPEVHDFLTERLFPRQAQVITIADLPALLPAG
jgi:MFS family permease